jgi:hypothetical protein
VRSTAATVKVLPDSAPPATPVDGNTFFKDPSAFTAQYVSLTGDETSLFATAQDVEETMPEFKRHLELFIEPKLTSRPRFKCMRNGGPPSPTNPDPVCA